MNAPLTDDPDYELFYRQRLANPYPLLARLRDEDPVHFCAPMKTWLVTRYDDVYAGLRDTKRFSTNRDAMYNAPLRPENRERAQPLIENLGTWLLNVDPPDHTRLRRLVNLAFTPRFLQALVPRIESIVDRLVEQTAACDEVDFIRSFSLPLPARVICDMLGIPEADQDRYCRCVEGLLPFSSAAGPGLNDALDEARANLDELHEFFEGLLNERRSDPRDDLLSALVHVEEEGDRLSRAELFGLCVFLFVAGHETTSGMIATGTLALLSHSDQFEKLKANPDDVVDSAVEEIIRYDASVTRGARLALEDFELRGRHIRKGQTVIHLIHSANRDPRQFPEPDRFDITRHPNKHLGFGFGIHFCMGAPLARLEGQIAFKAIARRLGDMTLNSDSFSYKPAMGIRSLEALPVRINEP